DSPYDDLAAERYADILVARDSIGSPIGTAVARIAAICLVHGATCAARVIASGTLAFMAGHQPVADDRTTPSVPTGTVFSATAGTAGCRSRAIVRACPPRPYPRAGRTPVAESPRPGSTTPRSAAALHRLPDESWF